MGTRKDHEHDCRKQMGDPMTAVHRFMDSRFPEYFHRHRHVHHHWEGIETCARAVSAATGKDYDLCYEAAILHVKADFNTGKEQFPIPHLVDYKGGEGDWPVPFPWSSQPPWSTFGCDKTYEVSPEKIRKIKEYLESV